MRGWERWQGLTVVGAAAAGLALGARLDLSGAYAAVLPLLVAMLTAVLLGVDAEAVRGLGRARRVVVASLVLNFAVTPLVAWALGAALLGDRPDLRVGLLLLLVTPCTDWYLAFTASARGDVAVATALLPLNLVLQLGLLPVYVLLLGGEAVVPDLADLRRPVLLALVVPLGLAIALRRFVQVVVGAGAARRWLTRPAGAAVPVLLHAAVLLLLAAQAPLVLDDLGAVWRVLVPLAVFFVVAPLVATVVAGRLRLDDARRVTLVMTTTARNSPVALGLAVAAFPDRPLVAVALVSAPLLELPALAVVAQAVRNRDRAGSSGPG